MYLWDTLLLEIGSIPLLIPTLAEKQVSVGDEEEEGKEDEEPGRMVHATTKDM